MKRNLILGLSALLVMGAFAGCMGDDDESTGDLNTGADNGMGNNNAGDECDVNLVDDDIASDDDGAALGDCETADE